MKVEVAVRVIQVWAGNLVVTGGHVCTSNGRDTTLNNRAVRHDGEVGLWASNAVESRTHGSRWTSRLCC